MFTSVTLNICAH